MASLSDVKLYKTLGLNLKRLSTETDIYNKPVFDYLKNNYHSGKTVDNVYDEEIPEDFYEDE